MNWPDALRVGNFILNAVQRDIHFWAEKIFSSKIRESLEVIFIEDEKIFL